MWNQELAQFSDQLLRFDYPSDWNAQVYQDSVDIGSSPARALVFLSNETVHAPCTEHVERLGSKLTCSTAVSGLRPDGVFVEWTTKAWFKWTLAAAPGRSIHIDEHLGKIAVVSGRGSCVRGTQQDVTVVIPRGVVHNYFEMNACLRGPKLARERSEVLAMVASTKILQP